MTASNTTVLTSETLTALTIAGFDPSSGAGITADLQVFGTHGIFAVSAITALTVQSTTGVRALEPVNPELLRQTLLCLEDDLPPAAIKIGMLGNAPNVNVVADYLEQIGKKRPILTVLDPVFRSSSGAALLESSAIDLVRSRLFPLVDAITPNLSEAILLSGLPCRSIQEMETAGHALRAAYPNLQVVITGGHLAEPTDVLIGGPDPVYFEGEHIASNATHGTGCAYSTSLLSNRLLGFDWQGSARNAKAFVQHAIRHAVRRGAGKGPMLLTSLPTECTEMMQRGTRP